MKTFWIGAIAATLSVLSGPAGAFELQGATVVLPEATSPFGEEGLNSRPGGSLNLLRDEPAPAGTRPSIKGDRAAVATLKAWTERAQGRA